MARIMAVGSSAWTSQRLTAATLRRVMALYRDPYVLVCDMSDGAARFAAAAARSLGWEVERYDFDPSKCAADCPPPDGHRRAGGPEGSWCPNARFRNIDTMLDSGVDLCLSLVRPSSKQAQGHRQGREQARRRDIGVWTVEQKGGE